LNATHPLFRRSSRAGRTAIRSFRLWFRWVRPGH